MVQTIFSTDLGQAVLAFVLVFTLVFAVLQKSKILGEGKKQIDALISLAIGLIVISVGSALNFIQQIIPFMAISLIIILVFMLLLGMFYNEGSFKISDGLKIFFGIIVFLAVAIAVLIFTGGWSYIISWFGSNGSIGADVILIVVVIVAVLIALFGSGKESGSKEK